MDGRLGCFYATSAQKTFLNQETTLPNAASRSFWLKGSVWQFPDYENVDTFIDRLVREELLAYDPVVHEVLQEQPQPLAPRTLRHRFLHATGLTHNHIRQVQRAQQAAQRLQQGASIADTTYELGYYDQPHLTRLLRRLIGYTPNQIIQASQAPAITPAARQHTLE
jgi:AraC-like DNA-binding protein